MPETVLEEAGCSTERERSGGKGGASGQGALGSSPSSLGLPFSHFGLFWWVM